MKANSNAKLQRTYSGTTYTENCYHIYATANSQLSLAGEPVIGNDKRQAQY
jgi:hypothetical protein